MLTGNGDTENSVEELTALKKKIAEYAEQINLFLLENQELRQKLSENEERENLNHSSVNLPKRKIPKPSNVDITPPMSVPMAVHDHNILNVPSETETKTKQRKKIIQAIDVNVFAVRKHIIDAKCTEFTVKQTSPMAPVKISVNKESEVESVRVALKNAKVSFHEYKWKDEKCKCFLIKGLVGVIEADLPEVKDELIKNGLPDTISLSLHMTGHTRAHINENPSIPVKMVVPPSFNEKALINIKFLNHVAVRFEEFKNKAVIQCINCQRFGHSSSGCAHKHRCVKCGFDHLRADCPRTFNKLHKLRCCNCEGEHTANNLTACKYYQQRYSKKKVVKESNVSSKNLGSSSSVHRQGVSFADVIREHNESNFNNNVKRASVSNNGLSTQTAMSAPKLTLFIN